MRTNYCILALAAVFAIVGFAKAQNYGPPYDCYDYYTCIQGPCFQTSGTCGPGGDPYNYVGNTCIPLGFCQIGAGDGCSENTNVQCCTYVGYNAVGGGQPCIQANAVCIWFGTGDGCSSG
jgi:hypothetical protein